MTKLVGALTSRANPQLLTSFVTPPCTMTSCHQFIPRDAGRAFRSTLFHQIPDYSHVKDDFDDDGDDEVFLRPFAMTPMTSSMSSSIASNTSSAADEWTTNSTTASIYRQHHRPHHHSHPNHYQQQRHSDGSLRDRSSLSSNENDEVTNRGPRR